VTTTGTAVTPTLAPPPLRNVDYRGIDPDTPAALNELETAWEHGHQPWRASAPDVAKAHLLSLGYTDPTVGPTLTNARRENGQPLGEITYTVGAGIAPGGVHGVVEVGQVKEGGIFFVRGSQGGSLHLVAVDRRDRSVTATVATSDPGPVTGTVRQPGAPARPVRSSAPDAKGSATLSFEDPDPSSPVIVELRQRVVDGVSIVEARVQRVPNLNGTEASGPGGVLRLDGLGSVRIGMSLNEARSAAGMPLTLLETPHCTTLRPDAIPPGFVLTAPGGTTIEYVIVTGPVATAKGIRVGSKLIDVWNAYTGHLTDHLSVGPGGHSGRVVYQVKDPGFEGLAMVFVIADDHVTSMLAGRGVQADGLCG
jgi:hypothetical protein